MDLVAVARKQRHAQLLGKIRAGQALGKAEIGELTELEAGALAGPAGLDPADVCRSQAEAAKYAGVKERTIRRWLADGMPRTKQGYYPKYLLQQWAQKGNGRPDSSGDKARLLKAEADLKEVKTKHAKLLLEIEEGGWLRREQIEAGRVERVLMVKRALLGMGRKVAGRWAGPPKERRKIESLINTEVRAIINKLAKK